MREKNKQVLLLYTQGPYVAYSMTQKFCLNPKIVIELILQNMNLAPWTEYF